MTKQLIDISTLMRIHYHPVYYYPIKRLLCNDWSETTMYWPGRFKHKEGKGTSQRILTDYVPGKPSTRCIFISFLSCIYLIVGVLSISVTWYLVPGTRYQVPPVTDYQVPVFSKVRRERVPVLYAEKNVPGTLLDMHIQHAYCKIFGTSDPRRGSRVVVCIINIITLLTKFYQSSIFL